MAAPSTYRGSITREQWLLNETRTVARLMADERLEDPEAMARRVLDQNLFQYPTEREQRSIAKACARRLVALSDEPAIRAQLVDLAAHGTPSQLAQTNLYAMACDNRIVWDFLATVTAAKFRKLDHSLPKWQIAEFLEGLRAQDDRAATWSDATLNKIRQVLAACLVNCGLYDRRAEQLLPAPIDPELAQAIRANGDDEILAGLGVTGR